MKLLISPGFRHQAVVKDHICNWSSSYGAFKHLIPLGNGVYLKQVQGNVLSLQVAEASLRVGKNPTKIKSKSLKDILVPWGGIFVPWDGTGWIWALGIRAGPFTPQESQECEAAGQLLSPLSPQAWQVCVTSALGVTTPRAQLWRSWPPSIHPSAPSLFGLSQIPLQLCCLTLPGTGNSHPSPCLWNMVTQNYSTLQKSPARQQCLLPSHSSGACKCNDSIPLKLASAHTCCQRFRIPKTLLVLS